MGSPSDKELIAQAWDMFTSLLGLGGSTTAQRAAATERQVEALDAVRRLEDAGEISSAEAKLLMVDAKRLREQLSEDPPTDDNVMCYDVAMVDPREVSLERLRERLPLLRELAHQRELCGAVVARVLPAIRADLMVLEASNGADDSAAPVCEQVRFDLASIEKLAKKSAPTETD